jgi:hypothetical protein
MTRYLMVVLSNPSAGRDDDFNTWYDEQHLTEILAVDGFVAAQRYRLASEQSGPHQYLAIYDVETDDLAHARRALTEAVQAGRVGLTDALDGTTVASFYFEPIGARQTV